MTIANRRLSCLAFTLAVGCSAGEADVDPESSDDLGQLEEETTPGESPELGTLEQAATNTVTIHCPSSTRATWIQALNGTVDLIAGQTTSPNFPLGGTVTTLSCSYASPFPQILDHTVQFAPGTVPSACVAKVTFSGEGRQIGGVPPFVGWQFKSKRVTGTATYNQATGACRVQQIVVGPPSELQVKVSQPCTPVQNAYRCPASVQPR